MALHAWSEMSVMLYYQRSLLAKTHICETTPGVKSFAGYVHLKASPTREKFDISTFYWYVQARKSPETAPLAIYLAGGPGESSMFGAMGQGGPCFINDEYNSTRLNQWSWNNEVNMLYIDQPVQTGFSYDTLVNGTLNLLTNDWEPADFSYGIPSTNEIFLVGVIPSQNPDYVTAGSVWGASALWHSMQIWTYPFPKDKSKNSEISLWGNSWGGFFITQTYAFFERQNELIRIAEAKKTKHSIPSGHELNMDVLGIVNGCIDPSVKAIHYLEMATRSTYGFKSIL
ncbi:MAG: hypothetical protein Q9227_007331 [Pyrenula ochraceoflavens]